MNLVLYFLLSLFLIFPAYSQPLEKCGFTVLSDNGEKFTVTANGVKQNKVPATHVNVLHLTTDIVKVQIDWQKPEVPQVQKTLYLRMGEVEHYRLQQRANGTYSLSFDRSEAHPVPAPASLHSTTVIVQESGPGRNGSTTTTTIISHATRCPAPVSERSVHTMVLNMRHETFESEKLKRAKEAVTRSCLASDQLKWLLAEFTYEATRLEFAKFAYSYVYDKGAYMAVAEGFEYANSKTELEKFIRAQPR